MPPPPAHPEQRSAQQALARDVTRRVHGDAALHAAEQVSSFFFGVLDPHELTDNAFAILRAEAPFAEVDASSLATDGDECTYDVLKLLTVSGLAASNGAAKRLLEQGGVSINKHKMMLADRHVATSEILLRGATSSSGRASAILLCSKSGIK